MAGKLTIVAAGQTYRHMVVVPKGEPANFLTRDELRQKFLALTGPVLGDDRAARLADGVLAINTAPGVGPLLRLACPKSGARLAGD